MVENTNNVSENNWNQQQTIIIKEESNGVWTAWFILAIIAIFVSWVPVIGWLVRFLGLLLSFIGLFKAPRGMAIAWFIISIIQLIIVWVILWWIMAAMH